MNARTICIAFLLGGLSALRVGAVVSTSMHPQIGASAAPMSMAVSPDGKWLVEAGRNGVVDLWDITTGDLIRSAALNASMVAFSPDSATVVIVSQPMCHRVALYDRATWRETQDVDVPREPNTLLFSPDGCILAILDFMDLTLMDYTLDGYFDGDRLGASVVRWTNDSQVITSPHVLAIHHRPDRLQVALTGRRQPRIYASQAPRTESIETWYGSFSALVPSASALICPASPQPAGVAISNSRGEEATIKFGSDSVDSKLISDISAGVNPNTPNAEGYAPLIAACMCNNRWLVKWLLEHGANPDLADPQGDTPLTLAADRDEDIVGILLDHHATPDYRPGTVGPPLAVAAAGGHFRAVKALVEHGANVNSTVDGQSALSRAVEYLDATTVSYLLTHGARVRVRTYDGKTLLQSVKATDPSDDFGVAALLKAAGEKE
jgi:hypothetical protein